MPVQYVWQAFLTDHPQGLLQPVRKRDGGGEGGLTLGSIVARLAEVSIVARAGASVSMTRQAFSLTLTRPSPVGHISAFCDAETSTSTPQRSFCISIPLTESTINSASVSRTAALIADRSATAPVEHSLWIAMTAR